MANLKKNFLSFAALGGQNPQILNLDFLKTNNIIPVNAPPFEELLKQEKPVKRFVSFPGLANLVLGNIEFVVDESRFQVREAEISRWVENKIIDIAKRYFQVLPYTPLKSCWGQFQLDNYFRDSGGGRKLPEIMLTGW